MIWILIVAAVTTAGPKPTLVEPLKFETRKARVAAAFRLDGTSLAPFVPPGARLLAYQSACLGVDRDGNLYPSFTGKGGRT